jgi:hypothetical protein
VREEVDSPRTKIGSLGEEIGTKSIKKGALRDGIFYQRVKRGAWRGKMRIFEQTSAL